MKTVSIKNLNIKFGTSGARGLASDLSDLTCHAFVKAFIELLKFKKVLKHNAFVLAFDKRESSPKIFNSIARFLSSQGFSIINGGHVPTPALALYAIKNKIPGIIITGSHIPGDRNGLKFYDELGEITKNDEAFMSGCHVTLPDLYNVDEEYLGSIHKNSIEINSDVRKTYSKHYEHCFNKTFLKGKRIGVLAYSTIAPDIVSDILKYFGAEVSIFGYSEEFFSVDTEALDEKFIIKTIQDLKKYRFDYIVSTDPDGDRPLLTNEQGVWIRGDILGILAAKALDAHIVITTLSSNTLIERSNFFESVVRTKIGSPNIIEAMQKKIKEWPSKNIVAFESNGGLLTKELMTRDAILPILSALFYSYKEEKTLLALISELPKREIYSTSIKGIEYNEGTQKLLSLEASIENKALFNHYIIDSIDRTDGLRIYLEDGNIIHFRMSKNAPELRAYCESVSVNTARKFYESFIKKWFEDQ